MSGELPAGWLFHPGEEIMQTPGVFRLEGIDGRALLARHVRGDWGDLDEHDKAANAAALVDGSRLLSAYTTAHGRTWVITEAVDDDGNRWRTTLLLPEEY